MLPPAVALPFPFAVVLDVEGAAPERGREARGVRVEREERDAEGVRRALRNGRVVVLELVVGAPREGGRGVVIRMSYRVGGGWSGSTRIEAGRQVCRTRCRLFPKRD